VAFGGSLVLGNLFVPTTTFDFLWAAVALVPQGAFGPVASAAALAMARADHAARRRSVAMGIVLVLAYLLNVIGTVATIHEQVPGLPQGEEIPTAVALALGNLGPSGLALLIGALGFLHREEPDGRRRTALALAALGFGIWLSFSESTSIPGPSALAAIAFGATVIACIVAWMPTTDVQETRARSIAVVVLAVSSALGLAYSVGIDAGMPDHGEFGIARLIGLVLLALAVFRYGLLDVELPRVALRRGPLAAGALAVLFVVAQVAQNFLASQYGLLLGGVIAGAFLFAARPIERAIEGRAMRTVQVGDSRRDAFRKAVRLAARAGPLTREEEAHLAHIADELGLSNRDAHAVISEVEAEARAP
jgi:hypothetical protein